MLLQTFHVIQEQIISVNLDQPEISFLHELWGTSVERTSGISKI